MRASAAWRAALLGLVPSFLGCALPERRPAPHAREPARWVVVEKRIGQLHRDVTAGDGQLDPKATLLVLEPLYPEDLNWVAEVEAADYFLELLEVVPAGELAPGETVTALLRVGGARPDRYYRVLAKSSTPESVILGDRERTVRGSSPVSFRFTSLTGGRAGLKLVVEEVSGGTSKE